MAIRNPSRITNRCIGKTEPRSKGADSERGATAIQVLIILVPVLFGLMGFAIDLGQLYLAKGELKAAANAMALAAAGKLIGTDQAPTDASAAARFTLDNSTGFGNKYNFGSLVIGDTTGNLSSAAPDPTYFTTLQDALQSDGGNGGGSGASRHALVVLNGEMPLTFWSFLPLASTRKVTVAARAVAGISAPLCTACSIEAFAVPAIDPTDSVNFGFVPDSRYTLGYNCTGVPTPGLLAGAVQRVEYLILNRFDANAPVFSDENTQLFRVGAQGIPGNSSSAIACVSINALEQVWVDAAPLACNVGRPPSTVQSAACGLTTRFESAPPAVCVNVPGIDTLSPIYSPDTDVTDTEAYASYTGNGRRIINVSIVDSFTNTSSMTILGFRQFLIEPDQGGVDISPADADGRFNALYIGSVAPIKQGRFDGCQISSGPGKVILHQ